MNHQEFRLIKHGQDYSFLPPDFLLIKPYRTSPMGRENWGGQVSLDAFFLISCSILNAKLVSSTSFILMIVPCEGTVIAISVFVIVREEVNVGGLRKMDVVV